MKSSGLFFLLMLISAYAGAQDMVETGIRTGGTSGVEVKYFYNKSAAIGGILGTFGNGCSLTMLVQKYDAIYYVPGLYMYTGIGLHAALYNGDNRYGQYYRFLGRETARQRNELGVGLNFVFGTEYRMPRNIPLVFSVDVKPFIEATSRGRISVVPDPSIGVRFIIR